MFWLRHQASLFLSYDKFFFLFLRKRAILWVSPLFHLKKKNQNNVSYIDFIFLSSQNMEKYISI